MQMNTQKKRTPSTNKSSRTKKLNYKNLTVTLYIVFALMSILNHNITTLSSFISELVVYITLGIMVYVVVKNTSLKGFAKFWNELD